MATYKILKEEVIEYEAYVEAESFEEAKQLGYEVEEYEEISSPETRYTYIQLLDEEGDVEEEKEFDEV